MVSKKVLGAGITVSIPRKGTTLLGIIMTDAFFSAAL
jgi:hypothetical protein